MNAPPEDEPTPTWTARLASVAGQIGVLLVALGVVGHLRAPDLPDLAPPLRLATLDGATVDLAGLRGGPVLVNFWATWCLPCRVELPALKAWSALHPEVTVIGVSVDRDRGALARALPGLALPWTVAVDDGATAAAWGVGTLPTTVLVGADGRVRGAHTGIALGPELELMLRAP